MDRCNLCGGLVEFIPNSLIYGKPYGSGFAYRCTKCSAFVGTHKNSPEKPLGILADKEMRELRRKCHALFDKRWSNGRQRTVAYGWLAFRMGYQRGKCHFSWMDAKDLARALKILEEDR